MGATQTSAEEKERKEKERKIQKQISGFNGCSLFTSMLAMLCVAISFLFSLSSFDAAYKASWQWLVCNIVAAFLLTVNVSIRIRIGQRCNSALQNKAEVSLESLRADMKAARVVAIIAAVCLVIALIDTEFSDQGKPPAGCIVLELVALLFTNVLGALWALLCFAEGALGDAETGVQFVEAMGFDCSSGQCVCGDAGCDCGGCDCGGCDCGGCDCGGC